MTLDEIRAEMAREPNAKVLVEWIQENTEDAAVREAIDAYFVADEVLAEGY
jgi:hypothetical protein